MHQEIGFFAIILQAVPKAWHKQYFLTFNPILKNKDKLLKFLEKIEKALGCKKPEKGPNKGRKASKWTSMQTPGCIPKKQKCKKFCQLCKAHGGAHTTHNMLECHKYGKDGGKKGSTSKKENPKEKGKEHANYAELTKKLKKLKKKLSHAQIGKKKCVQFKSDSDLDSEQEFGYSSPSSSKLLG